MSAKKTPAAKKAVAGKAKAKAKPRVSQKRKPGPAPIYTPELALQVCEHIASGFPLRAISALSGMPSISTMMLWLDGRYPAFSEQYARAREAQADRLAEEILSIADEDCTTVQASKHGSRDDDGEGNTEVVFDSTAVARNKLRVDARKWLASKMAPKKYGDKLAVGGADDLPPVQQNVTLGPAEAYKRLIGGA